jgi:hypothetical protein
MKKSFTLIFLLVACFRTAFAQDVQVLLNQAEMLLNQNKTEEAVSLYEQVSVLDAKNYQALAFLCNYHFILGQQEVERQEAAFLSLKNPTRMETAGFQDSLKAIYVLHLKKAENYLIQAYLIRRNDHLDDLAGRIALYKERIGIRPPRGKSSSLIQRILP